MLSVDWLSEKPQVKCIFTCVSLLDRKRRRQCPEGQFDCEIALCQGQADGRAWRVSDTPFFSKTTALIKLRDEEVITKIGKHPHKVEKSADDAGLGFLRIHLFIHSGKQSRFFMFVLCSPIKLCLSLVEF